MWRLCRAAGAKDGDWRTAVIIPSGKKKAEFVLNSEELHSCHCQTHVSKNTGKKDTIQ